LWTGIYPVHPYMAYDGAKLAYDVGKSKVYAGMLRKS
jgi:hypothetical protein